MVHALAVRLSSYAFEKLISYSPNFPHASITRQTHATHGPILDSLLLTASLLLLFKYPLVRSVYAINPHYPTKQNNNILLY